MRLFLRSLFLFFILVSALPLVGQKLYWVGGSGNFNDAAHWSYVSGGIGGAKTPTLSDDVCFDEKSFTSSSIISIIGGANCKDITFSDNTQSVILQGTQNEKITIAGNAKFNVYTQNNFSGDVWFNSAQQGNTLKIGFGKFLGNVYFDGGGSWELQSILNTNNAKTVTINSGVLNANSTSLSVGNIICKSTATFNLNNSKIFVYNHVTTSNYQQIQGIGSSKLLMDYSLNAHDFSNVPTQNNSNLKTASTTTVTNIVGPTCNGGCNGSAVVSGINGSPPYTIQWLSSTAQTYTSSTSTYTCTGLCANSYNVLITATTASGDSTVAFLSGVLIPAESPITIPPPSTTAATCNGLCNGSSNYIVAGSHAPYTVVWTTPSMGILTQTAVPSGTPQNVTNLCAGTYTINATDSAGCTMQPAITVTVSQPTAIVSHGSVQAPLCFGSCDGKMWVAPTGGTPFSATQSNGIKYTTTWDNVNTNDTIYNLCAGAVHTCTVTDSKGCTVVYTGTVPAAPSALSATINPITTTSLNCANVCNGTLSVTNVSGGTTPYTFSWLPSGGVVTSGATSSTYSLLCAGVYTCTITDAHNCTLQKTFTLTAPPAITHTVTAINPKCNGGNTGSIKDIVSGGTPNYTWGSWSPSGLGSVTTTSTSSTYSNIPAGTYSIVMTDSKGCHDTVKTTLTNPPVLNAVMSFTNPTCFGLNNGQICVTPSGGTGSAYTYSWTPAEPSTNCISSLTAGGYTVTVKDSNNCSKTVSATLTAPTQITATVTIKNPTCSNLCNASATVTASGGTGGYSYSWSCAAGNNTPILSGQCGNTTCTVTITDVNGCSVTKTVSFTNPNPLTVSISATSLVCANQCNAQINTSVTGGTPTYSYSWSGTGANPVSPNAPNQSNMCSGSYSVTVTDSNNCTTTATVSIANPSPIVISGVTTNPNCSGACDGSIIASITGGTFPNYTFSWNPPQAPNSTTVTALCAGSYTLNVNDANNCVATQTFSLSNPTSVTATVTPVNVTCAGLCNGSASAVASGGTAPYQYSWDGGAYTATASTSSLCAGTHTLQVKDSKGCSVAPPILYTITEPTALTSSVSNVTKSCLNICNGTADASASGGTPGYQYSWNSPTGPFSSISSYDSLCVGTNTLYVQDANGCTASTVFNVQVIVNVNILASSLSVSCHDSCDGSANATASGGTPNYTFVWNPVPASPPSCVNVNSCTAMGLCPGTYTVTVTDQTGCAGEGIITIANPPALTASVTTVDATCFGNCDGSALITPSGGTAPYTEQWSNTGVLGPNPTGLCPGSYTATVQDNRGCTVIKPITINSSSQFSVTPSVTSPTACLTSTGSLTLSIAGGTPTYTVNWTPSSIGTGTVISNLAAGVYTATISDNQGCDTVITVGVSDPTGPTTSVTVNQNVTCYGSCDGSATVSGVGTPPINVNWSTAPGTPNGLSPVSDNALCANTYPVQVTDGDGCISIATVTITSPTKIIDNAVINPLACSTGNTGSIVLTPTGGSGGGYTYTIDGNPTSNPITGLAAGDHTVVITDGSACSATYTYNIAAQTQVVIINITQTNELCVGSCNGTAQASVIGGHPAYTYTWTNSLGVIVSNSPNVASLCPGQYTLDVQDQNLCNAQAIITINAATPIVPNFTQQNNNCSTGCTGTASVSPTGGAGGGFVYNWNTPGSPTTSSVSALCPGSYYVIVTDTNHCSDTTHFTITAPTTVSVSVSYTSPSCNGYSNGSASVTPLGGTPSYTVTWSSAGCVGCVTTNSLTAGSYVVTATDSKGCTGSNSFVLADSAKMLANAVPTSPLCNNQCNGSITSIPTGGNGGYNYQWQGISPSPGNSPTASNLCPGTYTLIVVDSKNCRDTASVTINNQPAITLNESQTAATCGQSNGSISISTVTPTGTLAINWLSPVVCGTSSNCNNLSAGIYTVVLSDANNCKDTFQIGITNSNGPLVNLTTTDVTCYNSCNGSATVTVVSGTPSYTYSWNTATPAPTGTVVSNLCESTPNYISTVVDGLTCQTLTTFTISAPPQITDDPFIVNATCSGINDGSITSNGIGGTPYAAGYMYSIDGGAFSFTNSFTGLGIGTHTVCIKDSLGCSQCFNYTINASTFILSSISSTNNLCYGVCNASATLSNVNGGAPPYIIAWSDGQAGLIASNLCAGTYTATITDTLGCQVTQTTTISAPSTSVNPNYTITQPGCGLCNGTINLAPSGGNGPAYTYTWSTSANTGTITNVCAGLYQVDIADDSGCVSTISIPVSNSAAPNATVSATALTCSNNCNATASVTASGGTAPYSYNWISPASTSPSISNLCAGTYFVQVKDAANCVTTESVTISPPASPIVINQTITPTQCGQCDGVATYTATGGTGSLTYSWNGAVTASTTQSNLCAGVYTLVVSDGACSDTSLIAINSSNAPIVTITTADPTCSGLSTGSATATILGGVSPISTQWSNGISTNPDTGLGAGTYNVIVSDINGCTSIQTFTITAPSAIALSLSNTQLPSCSGVCNGLLTAIPSGGTMPYTYTWSPNGTNADTLGSACAGNYSVDVMDANGCSVSQNITLINNPFLINANPTVTQPNCAQCNGDITLNPTGGSGAYTYTWTTSPVNNTNQMSNVCAGIYDVDITDGIGCVQTVQIPVSSISSPSVTVNATDVTCNGLSNGSATATATGGNTPYIYSWSPVTPSVNTSTIGGLQANVYFVQVEDATGCIATQSVNIAEPAALNANATQVSPSCGVCNGSIATNVSGGTGSYSYVWSANAGSVTTASVSSLCAGIYTVQITDNGTSCTDTIAIGLNNVNGPSLSITTSSVSCVGMCDGSATVTATGGTPSYTYTWSPSSLGNNPTASGLCSGTNYMVQVEDAANCIQTQSLTIGSPNSLILSFSSPTLIKCHDDVNGAFVVVATGGTPAYTYSWNPSTLTGSNPTNLAAGVYTLTVTDANGCSGTQIDSLTNPAVITITGDTTTATCNTAANGAITTTVTGGTPSYTYTWSGGSTATTANLTNILPGSYSVMVTDAHGCVADTNFTVVSTVSITVNAGNDTNMCNNASIVLSGTVTGASTYNWQDISGTPILPANSLTVSVNPTGSMQYVLTADNSGCINSDTMMVSINPNAGANAGADQSVITGQGINIGGSPTNPGGGSVVWSPPTGLSDTTATNPLASPTVTTTYYVFVTNSFGCVNEDSVVVTVLPPFNIPNGFTPNGDGHNDTWVLDFIEKFPKLEIEVYNRWGEQLFYAKGSYTPWNGTYKGSPVPVGTYYYVIRLNDPLYPDHYVGPLTILR